MGRGKILIAFVLCILLTLAAAPAAAVSNEAPQIASDQRTFTIIANNSVPLLNISGSGVLSATIEGNADSFSVSWTFRGITNWQRAFASGSGVGSWDEGNDALTLTLTDISQWDMPGFDQPELPKTATMSQISSTLVRVSVSDPSTGTLVTGVPLRVFFGFGNPFEIRFPFVFESSVGTGSVAYSHLPGANRFGGWGN